MRDTGVRLRGASARERRRQIRRRRQTLQALVLCGAVLVALLVGWRLNASEPPSSAQATQPSIPAEEVAVYGEADCSPTPFFATYRSLYLYLPVPASKLTELAFHQASGDQVLHMESLLPDANMTKAFNNKGTGREPQPASTDGTPQKLTGAVLRMWRSNRSGKPDSAADVGAVAGTQVRSPVTGKVIKVKAYKLYDEYDDYEIHIQPTGWPEVDVVLIHVDKVTISEGDRVVGGVTPIASVRRLANRVTPQISAYTKSDGDHVHLQLNKMDVPGKLDAAGGS
ncbi:MAG: hypothetical protein Q8K99_06510 [Actinomycetota bacterium]|nr:hypothetical protein [Actinomycetota bacterium]